MSRRGRVARREREEAVTMCLTCGCMDAHLEMGESNITYEDVKKAADENGRSVSETLDIMERTKAKDREDHPAEYATS
jgi:hypothetical protein